MSKILQYSFYIMDYRKA